MLRLIGLLLLTCFTLEFSVGCTTYLKIQQEYTRAKDATAITADSIVLPIKFVPQSEIKLCGIAAIDMLSAYYDRPMGISHRQALIDVANIENGLTGARMKEFLVGENYFASVFPGSLSRQVDGLYHQLDVGHPTIAMLGTENLKTFHFVVVIGYNPVLRNIILLDPAGGQRVVSEEAFLERWQWASRFMLVTYPINKI